MVLFSNGNREFNRKKGPTLETNETSTAGFLQTGGKEICYSLMDSGAFGYLIYFMCNPYLE